MSIFIFKNNEGLKNCFEPNKISKIYENAINLKRDGGHWDPTHSFNKQISSASEVVQFTYRVDRGGSKISLTKFPFSAADLRKRKKKKNGRRT